MKFVVKGIGMLRAAIIWRQTGVGLALPGGLGWS